MGKGGGGCAAPEQDLLLMSENTLPSSSNVVIIESRVSQGRLSCCHCNQQADTLAEKDLHRRKIGTAKTAKADMLLDDKQVKVAIGNHTCGGGGALHTFLRATAHESLSVVSQPRLHVTKELYSRPSNTSTTNRACVVKHVSTLRNPRLCPASQLEGSHRAAKKPEQETNQDPWTRPANKPNHNRKPEDEAPLQWTPTLFQPVDRTELKDSV